VNHHRVIILQANVIKINKKGGWLCSAWSVNWETKNWFRGLVRSRRVS